MSTQRRTPELGPPPKPVERDSRREPSLPTRWTAIPSRGPRLVAPETATSGR